MKYVIDFLNGVREEFEGSLEAAKEMADDMAGYTQQDYVICGEEGSVIVRRPWSGVAYDPEETEDTEDEVIQFGDFGYYGAWCEE